MSRNKLICCSKHQHLSIIQLIVIFTVSLAIVMTACQKTYSENATSTLVSSLTDQSIFNGVPCVAPCWYGLTVGKSTEAEVLATLQALLFIDANTLQESKTGYWDPILQENIPAKLISASCKEPQEQQCVGLTVAENQLKIISVFPNYEITFLDVVDSLGNPDYVSLGFTPPVNSPGCSISLIWSNRQIIIGHVARSSRKLCDPAKANEGISKNLVVNSITYFLPEYIEFQLDASESYPLFRFTEQ